MSLCPRWLLEEEADLRWHVSGAQTEGFTSAAHSESLSDVSHSECTMLLHCVTTLVNTVPKYRVRLPQLRVCQSNTSPLRVYLVMELSHDTAAAAERLYYSTYSGLYRDDAACVSCRDTAQDDKGRIAFILYNGRATQTAVGAPALVGINTATHAGNIQCITSSYCRDRPQIKQSAESRLSGEVSSKMFLTLVHTEISAASG